MKPDLKKLKIIDPLRPQPTVDLSDQEGTSPYNPPDAFSKTIEGVEPQDMDPYLRLLMDDHAEMLARLDAFDADVAAIRAADAVDQASLRKLKGFMDYFRTEVVPHARREERELFVILRQRMLEHGEHSVGPDPITPIVVMEEEHLEAIETSAIAFSFMALARRLEDAESKKMVLSIGLERCAALSEGLRLHIHREDKIVFVLAHKFITPAEFRDIESGPKPE